MGYWVVFNLEILRIFLVEKSITVIGNLRCFSTYLGVKLVEQQGAILLGVMGCIRFRDWGIFRVKK